MKTRHIIFKPLPWLFRADAITLYPFVFYIDDAAMIKWRSHEEVHLAQVEHLGWWKFYYTYIKYHFKYGYHKNPLEVEAREKS